MRRSRPNAFSLLELLLAIAVMAALAALLFVGTQGMRSRADAARCLANLRQLATAGLLYANDRGGLLPDRTAWSSILQANRAASLLPYLDIPTGQAASTYQYRSLLTCPAAQRDAPSPHELFRTYAINQWAAGSSKSEESSWESTVVKNAGPLRLQATQAGTQAFFMDGPMVDDGGGKYRYSIYQRPDRIDYRPGTNWRTRYLHQERLHVVYLDGHAGQISQAEADADLIGLTNGTPSPRTHPFWGAGQ